MKNNNFFWEDYLILNSDIINQNNEIGAFSHYEKHGKDEKRQTKLQDISKYSFIYNFEHQKKNLKNFIHNTYGLQLNMNEQNKIDCSQDFFYLCNKFKIMDEKHKNILYLILNRSNYSKPKNNSNNNNFQMITSLYNEKNIDRAMELLLVLSQNLQNKYIQNIHLLFENNGNSKDNLIRTVVNILLIRNKLYENLKIVNIKEKPNFSYIFQYANQSPKSSNIMVANSDIVLDDSLQLLGNKLKDDDLICLSRYNWNKNSKSWNLIYMEFNGNKYTNIFSHDVWIFKSPMKYPINIDICLGDMFSDSYIDFKLKNTTNYSCFNLAKSIRAHHIQDKDSFSELVKENPNLMTSLLDKIKHKENGNNDVLYGISYSTIEEWNHKNKNKFVSNLYFQQHTSEFLC
jgi:hypothetical protein